MKILFASAEVAPIIKIGGLADVAGSLPRAIKKLGHDIRIVMPRYKVIDEAKYPMKLLTKDIPVTIGQEKEKINIYQTQLPDSDVPVYLLENKKYLTKNGVYYEATEFANVQRFLFFSKAVLEIFEPISFQPDILHCQDWHTGLLPLLIKMQPAASKFKPKTLFTVHNMAMRGRWNWQGVMDFLGFNGYEHANLQEKFIGPFGPDFDSIQQGILGADIVNTVSPGYAKEIMVKKYHARGLEASLRKRQSDFYGILNGIDTESWNPEKDSSLKTNYSLKTIDKRKEGKLYLQKKLGLHQGVNVPLLGVISRLAAQKGIDLICQVIDEIMELKCQIVFLGTGDKRLEEKLRRVAKKYPGKISANIQFDAELARQIYAGVDIFLMPSRFEPCGLGQLIAMRYGAIPLVRATGGLKNTVWNVKVKRKGLVKKVDGTGFVFALPHSSRLFRTIKRALELYENRKIWRQIQVNAMSQDFSWTKSVIKYVELYKKLCDQN